MSECKNIGARVWIKHAGAISSGTVAGVKIVYLPDGQNVVKQVFYRFDYTWIPAENCTFSAAGALKLLET